jgi:hypothetical protein
MFLAEGTAGQCEDARVLGRIEQRLEEIAADETGGPGDQRNFGCGTHAPELNKSDQSL